MISDNMKRFMDNRKKWPNAGNCAVIYATLLFYETCVGITRIHRHLLSLGNPALDNYDGRPFIKRQKVICRD